MEAGRAVVGRPREGCPPVSKVSIVIPVRNLGAVTRRCLEVLLAERPLDTEIVVVDDGSTDDTPALLESMRDQIVVITHREARGFAIACNAGAEAATSGLLVFLNNDTEPQAGWLDALVGDAMSHERAAAIGARLLSADGTIQHAGMAFCHDLLPRHAYRGFPGDHPAVARSRALAAVTGACMLVRRERFDAVGGFDEEFRNGFEDVDLCLKLRERGWETRYCAESVVVHLEAATRGDDPETFARNSQSFLDRWRDRIVPDDLTRYVEDGFISIDYSDLYPLNVRISPLVAVVEESGEVDRTFELLGIRARQVFDLLKENTQLRVRLGELEPPA